MPSKPPAVYWDSCCFIGRIRRESDKISELEHLTAQAEKGNLLIVTSTLTLAEVFKDKTDTTSKPDIALQKIRAYFKHPWIVLRAVDRRTAELAGDFRLAHKSLRIPDAVHVATAVRWGVMYMHTYDEDHLLNKTKLFGSPPLEIIRPRSLEDHPLFAMLKDDSPSSTEPENENGNSDAEKSDDESPPDLVEKPA